MSAFGGERGLGCSASDVARVSLDLERISLEAEAPAARASPGAAGRCPHAQPFTNLQESPVPAAQNRGQGWK